MNRLIALLGAGLACVAITAQAVPNPVVTGPIASTAIPGQPSKDHIFFATDHPLAVNGYIEEEYFIEGTANRYNTPTGATGSVIDSGHGYKTRVVVRRPASDKKSTAPSSSNGRT
jgi:Alpha/beta hydrolase domain